MNNNINMKIHINDNTLIKDLQAGFNSCFPFLKIEFFGANQKYDEASSKKLIRNNRKFGEFRTAHRKENVVISPDLKVSDLEFLFQSIYGLSIQIFRKSGSIWLEATSTNNWTLGKQNTEAKEFALHKSR
jgi:hypothetical protein